MEEPGEAVESIQEVEEEESLNHDELVALTNGMLNTLLQSDPLLCDLPKDVTPNEVAAQIAMQTGSALTVEVVRADDEVLRVVVERSGARLSDLRRAIQRHVELRELRRTGRKRCISWRHVWKAYCLQTVDGERLQRRHDTSTLTDLRITNKSKLSFVKRLRDKLSKE